MSAVSVSDSENQVFRVPLVDAQAQQSSTGKYPWSMDASSSTFVYLKNATGTAQNYLLQVNYDGGAYALGLKTIEAGQTAAFDLRKLRDSQVPDQGGHAIPLNVTHGQVFWSVHGSKDLVLVGRFEQVDTVEGLSSTAACQVCCPATFHEATISPDATTGLSGDTTQFTVQQINWDCNGNPLAPFTPIGVSWTSGNDSVATVDSIGLATAQATGSAAITAMWNARDWIYDPATCNFDDPPPSGGFCNAKGCFGSDGPVGAQATFTVRPKINSITPGRGLVGNMIAVSIDGQGLGIFPTVSAGNGITVTVNFANSTSIHVDASFAVASTAVGGNHGVTVTVSGQTSNSMNFFVQVPTSLKVLSSGVATNAYQNPLANGCPPSSVPGRNGGTAGPYGMQIFIRYQVMDQGNPAQPIVATMQLREDQGNFMVDGQSVSGSVSNGNVTVSGTTEADGTFTDPFVGACATGQFTVATFDQDLFMSTNHTLDVRGNHWALTGRYGCGNMNNGNDVSVTVNCP